MIKEFSDIKFYYHKVKNMEKYKDRFYLTPPILLPFLNGKELAPTSHTSSESQIRKIVENLRLRYLEDSQKKSESSPEPFKGMNNNFTFPRLDSFMDHTSKLDFLFFKISLMFSIFKDKKKFH
jgi:hypothetical protein